MTFIQNAKKLKKEKGLTTNELSKICGIPLGTLSKLFSGTIEEPKLSAAVAIAKSLGTTVDTLCDITDGTYTNEERDIIAKYRVLDPHAKKLVSLVISNEMARLDIQLQNMSSENNAQETNGASNLTQEKIQAKTNSTAKTDDTVNVPASDVAIRTLPLYSSTSNIGSTDNKSSIRVKNTGKVTEASYALRVNGDSMAPEYGDGDILIIKEQDAVISGELCIYICDGNGYFRKYSDGMLISLNPEYPNVDLGDFKEAKCVGLVLGRLRSKKN
ncbi:MAG: LexA family transcriptional regulator [Clostridia bacterium]|nr:LexA family transcriptional regulator [Clostridia bacterium]